ncbi:MAG: sugar kinase [Kiritimatiellae bacterium]|nr:sugar kinase [Kiritimatiellia bacterium]
MQLVVVGSVGLDTVETPAARRADVLGGSVSYACAAASFFTRVGMVGVVGSDFPDQGLAVYERFGIDLNGLQRAAGKTFRWSGVYERDMNARRTLSTELNVFAAFQPDLPAAYRATPYLFLANISPELQLHVLGQAERPRFTAADTMDLWIETARDSLMALIAKVNMLTLNDTEARQLTGESSLVRAARTVLGWGPDFVVIKKGEHGSMLFSNSGLSVLPAFPLEAVSDPTGAGDTFAGGFMGFLAREGRIDEAGVRRAMAFGSVVASFCVERFSLERMQELTEPEIRQRFEQFRRMVSF